MTACLSVLFFMYDGLDLSNVQILLLPCSSALQRIMSVNYSFPPGINLSADALDLFSRIFVADPSKRITIPLICQHAWFLKNLPSDLAVRPPSRSTFHPAPCYKTVLKHLPNILQRHRH